MSDSFSFCLLFLTLQYYYTIFYNKKQGVFQKKFNYFPKQDFRRLQKWRIHYVSGMGCCRYRGLERTSLPRTLENFFTIHFKWFFLKNFCKKILMHIGRTSKNNVPNLYTHSLESLHQSESWTSYTHTPKQCHSFGKNIPNHKTKHLPCREILNHPLFEYMPKLFLWCRLGINLSIQNHYKYTESSQ